ncbi:endonuclease/exonuclease/phosphatase family protein [Janthinobacterium svalbardensis]|uniref:endonuclease/exonuclease/phosphatase family protein n=1 Tax=Janthinobacterium svalbardensis TaxID=368607 RepID=UPI002FCD6DB4
MPKILFWNINKKNLINEIVDVLKTHDFDVLILAESEIDDDVLLDFLNFGRERVFFKDINISKRIKFYSTYDKNNFQIILDDGYFSIRKLSTYIGPDILLVAVHLPSKLHAEPVDQLMESHYLSSEIKKCEEERGLSNTLVIGDFNMSPFEDGMVSASGLHAILDQEIVRKLSRIVKNREYPFFYNPMWGRLGDLTVGPPGTHKYSKSVEVNYFWHTFDQVLLRPGLLDYFSPENMSVVEAGGSDHYPIFINLETEVIND